MSVGLPFCSYHFVRTIFSNRPTILSGHPPTRLWSIYGLLFILINRLDNNLFHQTTTVTKRLCQQTRKPQLSKKRVADIIHIILIIIVSQIWTTFKTRAQSLTAKTMYFRTLSRTHGRPYPSQTLLVSFLDRQLIEKILYKDIRQRNLPQNLTAPLPLPF